MADWISLLAGSPDPTSTANDAMASFQAGQDRAQQQAQQQQAAALASQQATQAAIYRGRLSDLLRNGDTAGAAAAAFAAGDDKAGTGFTTLQKQTADQHEKGAGAFGEIVRGVAGLPYEQRRAAIQAAKPTLTAMGYDPHAVDGFDPTDDNLAGVGGLGYSMKDRVGDQTAQFNAQTQRLTATNPVVVGDTLVARDGTPLYRAPKYEDVDPSHNLYQIPGVDNAGGSAAPAGTPDAVFGRMIGAESGGRQMGANGQPLTSSKGAVGIAQVMPGTAPTAAKLAGLAWDENRYRTDPQYNAALGRAYFGSLVQRYGGDTAKAVAAYNCGPGNLDAAVAQGGVNWRQCIPQETQKYLGNVLGGGRPQGQPTAGGPKLIQTGTPKDDGNDPQSQDKPSVDMLAMKYLVTGALPPMGQGAAGLRRAVFAKAAELKATNNWSDADLAVKAAQYKGAQSNIKRLNDMQGTIGQAEDTALANGQRMMDASRGLGGQTGSPLLNRGLNALGYQTGSAEVAAFKSAYLTFVTETAKVLSSNPSGSGQLTDAARHEAMEALDSAASPRQRQAQFDILRRDMAARSAAIQGQLDKANARIEMMFKPNAPAGQQFPPAPSANAVAALRAKPGLAAAFDQRFGAGASARVLGH